MAGQTAGPSPRVTARLAGLLYLVVVIAGGWAQLFVRGRLIVRDDAAATAANILAHALLFRLGFAADLIAVVFYIAVVFVLYGLLKPAGRSLSLLAAFFGMAGNAVFAVNLLNHLAAAVVLDNAHPLGAFKTDQLQALALLFLKLHGEGYFVVMVFFGFYLALLGALICRSSFMPRMLGVLLVAGGLADVAGSFVVFLALPVAATISSVATALGGIAEIALVLWLLTAGVNAARWTQQAVTGR